MRDPRRISGILQTLGEYWRDTPDIRLGQLLLGAVAPSTPCPELFYIEDEELLSKLQVQADWTAETPVVSFMINDTRRFLDIGVATFRVGYSGVSIELSRETEEIHLVKIKGIKLETLQLLKEHHFNDFEKFLLDNNGTVEWNDRSSYWEPETFTISYRSDNPKATASLADSICIITDQSEFKLVVKSEAEKE